MEPIRAADASAKPPVGRLAPSPTGSQHLGNARTYLLAWLQVRSQSGTLRLRLEDLDGPRVKPHAADEALEDIRWLGLDWDGDVLVQSRDLAPYHAAFERLKAAGLVYPCTCTRADIEAAASAPHAEHDEVTYPGTCRNRAVADADALGGPVAWRFRVTTTPEFVDRFRGPVRLDLTRVGGDFVVWRSGGTPAYQLAVVVDDAAAGVTEVLRGDDLIPSTPRQILLARALGLPVPRYAHVPLAVGPDGRRLAKRHGDSRLSSYRKQGVSPERVVGLIARSCGLQPLPTPARPGDFLKSFTLGAVPRWPWVVPDVPFSV